jgi:pimeloyl-ACP methyl ester carboxylesterase
MQAPLEPVALESIDVPTLVVHGTADRIVPIEHARSNATALPAGALVELAGVGHVSPLQAPAALGAVVAGYLASTGSRP